jgi:2-C-methyl-D-erythritol 4-phosphate cytidylyltransferase
MKKFVVIVAGGSGSRMKAEIPKQFIEICGEPILMKTIRSFFEFNSSFEFIVVLPENQQELWLSLCQKHGFTVAHHLVIGGATRFHSVQKGLKLINSESIVLIHDGVRPLVSADTIERCCRIAEEKGNAIPVLPINESLRKVSNKQNKAVNRNEYFIVQTPQTFRFEQIKKAYFQNFQESFTDDASVVEMTGIAINLVDGNPENIKITTPTDLIIAETYCKQTKSYR